MNRVIRKIVSPQAAEHLFLSVYNRRGKSYDFTEASIRECHDRSLRERRGHLFAL